MNQLLLVLGLLWVSATQSAFASVLLVEHFETLCEVHVSISTGGIQHDPLPGFDKVEFEKRAHERILDHLGKCAIRETETSEPRFWIWLRKSHEGLSEGRVLLQVTAELRESAYLKRQWTKSTSANKTLMVTTWQISRSSVVEECDAIENLLDLISSVSKEFAVAVGEARANSETSDPELRNVPEGCLESMGDS